METIASAVWFFSGGVLTYARYFGLKLGARGMRVTKRATAAEMATLRGLKGEITAEGFQRMEGEARRAAFDQLGRVLPEVSVEEYLRRPVSCQPLADS